MRQKNAPCNHDPTAHVSHPRIPLTIWKRKALTIRQDSLRTGTIRINNTPWLGGECQQCSAAPHTTPNRYKGFTRSVIILVDSACTVYSWRKRHAQEAATGARRASTSHEPSHDNYTTNTWQSHDNPHDNPHDNCVFLAKSNALGNQLLIKIYLSFFCTSECPFS